MGKNGKLLNLNSDSPKYGNKSLDTKEQENELKRRKITFSFSYFKQIPNFQIGECSKGWHIGHLERLGALGTMTPQEVLEENRGSIALRCHPIDWSAKNIPIQRKDLDWLPKEILDNCHRDILAKAEIYVDSIITAEINFQLSDSIVFPEKPLKPGWPGPIFVPETIRAKPIFVRRLK